MNFIPPSVTRSISRSVLTTQKNSPHILFVGGVAAIVTGAILACRATLKLEESVDEIKHSVDSVNLLKSPEIIKHWDDNQETPYTEQEYRKDLIYVYAKSAVKIGRLYGPAILVGGTGIALLTGSHVQLARRNTALTVTLAAVTKAFDEYRIRVKEEIGEQRELELHHAVTTEKIDGVKGLVKVADPNKWSMYARFFDEESPNFTKDPEMNRIFIQCQQNYANQRLQARGHVFLNEVYEALGLSHSRAGAVVGWVIGDDGDNFIDFGLFEATSSAFINNYEPRILLDFNVDGVVYDKIKE